MGGETEQAAARADVQKTHPRQSLATEHLLQRHHRRLDAFLRHALEELPPVLTELEALATRNFGRVSSGGLTGKRVGPRVQHAPGHDGDVFVARSHCMAMSTGQSRSACSSPRCCAAPNALT